MANYRISDLTNYTNPDPANDVIEIVDNTNNANKKITRNNLLGITSTPVGINDIQTLTQKTLTAPTISSPILSGTITGTYTLAGTPTFPSSVATLTGSQTLTNKVLTSPTINTPTITNASITADAITGFTTSNSGTIYGVSISGGTFGTNALGTNAVQPNQLATNAITLGYAQATADQGSITTETLLTGLAVTVTVPSGSRYIRITCLTHNQSSVSDSNIIVRIKEGSTILQSGQIMAAQAGSTGSLEFSYLSNSVTTGSHTYTVSLARNTGTGTITSKASSTQLAYILVQVV